MCWWCLFFFCPQIILLYIGSNLNGHSDYEINQLDTSIESNIACWVNNIYIWKFTMFKLLRLLNHEDYGSKLMNNYSITRKNWLLFQALFSVSSITLELINERGIIVVSSDSIWIQITIEKGRIDSFHNK